MSRIALAVLALSAIAGCAQLSANLAERDETRQVSDLVGYVHRVAAMRPDAQRRELNDANQTYARDQGLYPRLRLALLLTLPGTAFMDDTRAAGLLEPVAGAAADASGAAPLRQFGAWLHAQLGERAREQRKTAQLKEQIDALRAIERTLNERRPGSGR